MIQLQEYFSEIDSFKECRIFTSTSEAADYMRQAIQDVNDMQGAIYVAEYQNSIVGFIQGIITNHSDEVMHNLSHVKSTDGWIGLLFLDPKYRGKGIGQLLLNKMKSYFQMNNCNTMRLKVASDNKLAIGVYAHYGFKQNDIEMILDL